MIGIGIFLLMISATVMMLAGQNVSVSKSIPFSCIGVIVFTFTLGILTNLNIAFWTTLTLTVLCYVGVVFMLIRRPSFRENLLYQLRNQVLLVWGIVILVLLFCDWGMKAGALSDDFSHWAYIVKEMVYWNDFGTNSQANAMFASYPPGMAVFQYFICRLYLIFSSNQDFVEWPCFFAYHILLMSLFLPFLKRTNTLLSQIVFMVGMLMLPPSFYMAYYDLSIEVMLAVLPGAIFARILLEREKDWVYHATIWLSLFLLVIMKDAGIVFSCFVGIAYVTDLIITAEKHIKDKKVWYLGTITGVSLFLPKLLWNMELITSQARRAFSQTVDASLLIRVLIGTDDSYRREVLRSFGEALFSRTVEIDNPWSGSTSLQPNWKMSYFSLFCAFVIVLAVFNYLWLKWLPKNGIKIEDNIYKLESFRIRSISSIWIIMFWVYALGIGVAYISNFSEAEAKRLAAFYRYVNVPFLAMYVVLAIYAWVLIQHLGNQGLEECHSELIQNRYRLLCCGLLLITLLIAPSQYLFDYGSRRYVWKSNERRNQYKTITELIKANCEAQSKVCYIDQDEWLYPYITIRFDVRPIILSPISSWESWYIRDDTFGEEACTDAFLNAVMTGFDYVAIHETDSFLEDQLSELFDSELSEDSLWYVDRESGLLRLIQ